MTAPSKGNRRSGSKGDLVLKIVVGAAAIGIVALLIGLGLELTSGSWLSIETFGLGFITGSTWNSVTNTYNVLPALVGTLTASAIALILGLPIGLGVAIFLSERAKGMRAGATALGSLVELLAAVPSVIYGLWGLFFLSPLLKADVEKPLHRYLGTIPIFSGTPFGLDFFTAGVILAIMIIPTISAVSRNVLNAVPNSQREAMYSLGATDWEVTRHAVLPYARAGIFAGIVLGLGRALGETMAVTLVIGNTNAIPTSLFSPGQTISTLLANQFFEAVNSTERAALIEAGLVLLVITLLVNVVARGILSRFQRGRGVGLE